MIGVWVMILSKADNQFGNILRISNAVTQIASHTRTHTHTHTENITFTAFLWEVKKKRTANKLFYDFVLFATKDGNLILKRAWV